MQRSSGELYSIVVKNRPGELAKLTKLLSEAGMNVSGLRIANLGPRASIQFALPRRCGRRHAPRAADGKAGRPG